MSDHQPWSRTMDMTPDDGGVARDEFGWWLAYHIRTDGSVNWLGVSRSQYQAAEWAFEEIYGENPWSSKNIDARSEFDEWMREKGIRIPKDVCREKSKCN